MCFERTEWIIASETEFDDNHQCKVNSGMDCKIVSVHIPVMQFNE